MRNFIVVEISTFYIKFAYSKSKKNLIKYYDDFYFDFQVSEKILTEKLIFFISSNKITTKNIAIILKNDSIKRFINLPTMKNSDLKKTINNNLSDFFPIDINNYSIDYKILSSDKENTNIMLVAIPNNIINFYLKIFEKLSLKCFCIDTFYNAVADYFSFLDDEVIFIGFYDDKKYTFIYLYEKNIQNIRDFEFTDQNNIVQEINRSFDFYSLELFKVKKVFLLDNCDIVYNAFLKYNIEIINKDTDSAFDLKTLPLLGFIKRIY